MQSILKLLGVANVLLVEDHQVDLDLPVAPVGVDAEQFAHQCRLLLAANAHQQNRTIAGDGVGPQPGLPSAVRRQGLGSGAQGRVGIEEHGKQLLRLLHLGRVEIEFAQLGFTLGASLVEGQIYPRPGLTATGQRQRFPPRHGRQRDVGELGRGVGRQLNLLTQRHDRVQCGAGGAGKPGVIAEGRWGASGPPPAQEVGAIAFVRAGDLDSRFHGQQVCQIERLLIGRARATAEEQTVHLGQVLTFDEEFTERRVTPVGGLAREHYLAVAGEPQSAGPAAAIDQRNTPNLNVLFGRDGDLHTHADVVIPPPELRLMGLEVHFLLGRWCTDGLVTRRPEVTTLLILNVDPGAPGVQGGVCAPTGESYLLIPRVTPGVATVTAAGAGDQHSVASVGEEMDLGQRGVRRHAPGLQSDALLLRAFHPDRFLGCFLDWDLTWHLLLQQKLDTLCPGIGVETPYERPILEIVGQRCHNHPLMVDHIRAHDGPLLSQGEPGGRVIHRLVEAILTEHLLFDETGDVPHHFLRRERQGQQRGVWRDHQILAQAALAPQPRHAKTSVLIVHLGIKAIVARLRYAPGHTILTRVGDLALHDRPVGLVQKRLLVVARQQIGHKVLKH